MVGEKIYFLKHFSLPDFFGLRGLADDHCLDFSFLFQVTYMNSFANFTGSHELTVKNKKGKLEKITADRFLIATGLRPRFPDVPGAQECCISRFRLLMLHIDAD